MKVWSLRAGGVLLIGALVFTIVAVSSRPAAPAAAQEGADLPSISVVGQGVVIARPDLARVRLGVEVTEPSLSAAQQQAAAQMEQVINSLLGFGIDRGDIQTVRYSVQPVYDQRDERSVLTGYRVVNVVAARISELGRLGEIIDAVVQAGAGRVEGIAFEIADESTLKEQARAEAVAHARAKAEQLARLTGVTLGPPINIRESDTGGVLPVDAPTARMAEAATPILEGELEVRTQVQIDYAIQ